MDKKTFALYVVSDSLHLAKSLVKIGIWSGTLETLEAYYNKFWFCTYVIAYITTDDKALLVNSKKAVLEACSNNKDWLHMELSTLFQVIAVALQGHRYIKVKTGYTGNRYINVVDFTDPFADPIETIVTTKFVNITIADYCQQLTDYSQIEASQLVTIRRCKHVMVYFPYKGTVCINPCEPDSDFCVYHVNDTDKPQCTHILTRRGKQQRPCSLPAKSEGYCHIHLKAKAK